MIKNAEIIEEFEDKIKRDERPDFYKNLKIVEALHREALQFKVFGKDPLDGIETDIHLAKAINSAGTPSQEDC